MTNLTNMSVNRVLVPVFVVNILNIVPWLPFTVLHINLIKNLQDHFTILSACISCWSQSNQVLRSWTTHRRWKKMQLTCYNKHISSSHPGINISGIKIELLMTLKSLLQYLFQFCHLVFFMSGFFSLIMGNFITQILFFHVWK